MLNFSRASYKIFYLLMKLNERSTFNRDTISKLKFKKRNGIDEIPSLRQLERLGSFCLHKLPLYKCYIRIFSIYSLTLGKLSEKNADTKQIFKMAKVNENIAGQNHQFSEELSIPQTENAAPVTGPTIKPIAKATPTNAYKI